MTLSSSTLQAIEQAGLGLFNAHQAVPADVQAGGARAMAQMATGLHGDGSRYSVAMAKPSAIPSASSYPVTPDGRYFVVRGRLWRLACPDLPEEDRVLLVSDLMRARREVALALRSHDEEAQRLARQAVDAAKRGLGERGPVWWRDGAPDYNRRLVRHTTYAGWFAMLDLG